MFLGLTQVIQYVASCLVKEPSGMVLTAVALCSFDTMRLSLE